MPQICWHVKSLTLIREPANNFGIAYDFPKLDQSRAMVFLCLGQHLNKKISIFTVVQLRIALPFSPVRVNKTLIRYRLRLLFCFGVVLAFLKTRVKFEMKHFEIEFKSNCLDSIKQSRSDIPLFSRTSYKLCLRHP